MQTSFPPGTKRVEFTTRVPAPVDEVWPFFCDPKNLERLTPPFLRFQVLGASGPLGEGVTIDYKLRLHGIPLRWRSELTDWELGVRFVDRAVTGPFRVWHHQHLFEADGDGTKMTDIVHYALPLGRLGRFFGGWMVDRDVRRIFAFREQTIRDHFKGADADADAEATSTSARAHG